MAMNDNTQPAHIKGSVQQRNPSNQSRMTGPIGGISLTPGVGIGGSPDIGSLIGGGQPSSRRFKGGNADSPRPPKGKSGPPSAQSNGGNLRGGNRASGK